MTEIKKDFSAAEMRQLAMAAKAGESDAQTELMARLYPPIRKHIGFVMGFTAIVEDVVQESMVAIYRALPTFRGDSSPKTWALTIATRIAWKHQKHERRHAKEISSTADLALYDLNQDAVAETVFLAKAISRLSSKKREIFVVMAILEMSAKEAAQILGISANTAASRFRHAREELQNLYTDKAC